MSCKLSKTIFFILALSALLFLFCLPASAMTEDGKVVIMIDPGHGGNDPGAVNGKTYESTNALLIAEEMKTVLEGTGKFKVYLTRTDNNTYMLRYPRAIKADEKNADFCISLHFNSSTDKKLKGTQVLASVKNQYYIDSLSRDILARMTAALGTKSLGILREKDNGQTVYYWSTKYNWDAPFDNSIGPVTDYYGLLNWCSKFGIPSVIVEHCFISNDSDVALIRDPAALKKMAKADADALIAYYGNHTHTFTEEKITDYPASCTYRGKESYHCTVCGARKDVTYISDSLKSDAHFWYLNDYKAPTCTKEGSKTYVCSYTQTLINSFIDVKNHTYTETIPPLEHKYKQIGSEAPAHGKDGYKLFKCENCGDQYTETLPMKEDHTFEETERKAASCTVEGYVKYTCKVCGETKKEIIPTSDAHEYETLSESPASCEKDGEKILKCKLCGGESSEILPAVGHNYQEKESRKPTCTEAGYVVRICTKCGNETREDSEPLGHTVEEKELNGAVYHVCSVCGFSEDMPETAAPETTSSETLPPVTEPVSEPETEKTSGTEKDGRISNGTLIMIFSSVLVISVCLIILILLLQKKKKKAAFSYVSETPDESVSEKEEIK